MIKTTRKELTQEQKELRKRAGTGCMETKPMYQLFRDYFSERKAAISNKDMELADRLEQKIFSIYSIIDIVSLKDAILLEMSKAPNTKLKWKYRKKRTEKPLSEDEYSGE